MSHLVNSIRDIFFGTINYERLLWTESCKYYPDNKSGLSNISNIDKKYSIYIDHNAMLIFSCFEQEHLIVPENIKYLSILILHKNKLILYNSLPSCLEILDIQIMARKYPLMLRKKYTNVYNINAMNSELLLTVFNNLPIGLKKIKLNIVYSIYEFKRSIPKESIAEKYIIDYYQNYIKCCKIPFGCEIVYNIVYPAGQRELFF
jgi:hypothetical protein